MSKDRQILEALQKAVIAAVADTDTPSLPIKMVGRTITPPNDGKWLEVIQIPNNLNRTWDSATLYRGILRLIVHWPIDDTGAYQAIELAGSIMDHFTKGKKLSDEGDNVEVTVEDIPRFLGADEQPPEILYPISIRYRCYNP